MWVLITPSHIKKKKETEKKIKKEDYRIMTYHAVVALRGKPTCSDIKKLRELGQMIYLIKIEMLGRKLIKFIKKTLETELLKYFSIFN